MKLRIAFTAAVALAMTVGCSAAQSADEEISSSSESNLSTCDTGGVDGDITFCDDPGKSAIRMTSFSPSSGLLFGQDGFGTSYAVTLTHATKFHAANVNKFIPVEPTFSAVVQYNSFVAQKNGYAGVATLVSAGGFARLQIKNGTVKAFRPVSGQ